MKKLFLTVMAVLVLVSQVHAVDINDFQRGDSSDVIKGTSSPSDYDTLTANYLVDPLEKMISNYLYGCSMTWASNSTITVGVGEVVCMNGANTIRRIRRNTATTTIDMAVAGVGGIDSGSAEAASTWYDIYAVADANATTFTVITGKHGTALSDVTYYRLIGRFYNNSGSNITAFTVESSEGETGLGAWCTTDIDAVALATNTVYLASTDGFVLSSAAGGNPAYLYTDSANPPTTARTVWSSTDDGRLNGGGTPVRKGDYWKVTAGTIYWIPTIHVKK